MRVFVSYSFRDKELYLLTLLVSKLRTKGYIVQLSEGNNLTESYIKNSDFFVGIITNNSFSVNNVFKEWLIAGKLNKQNLLLIEEGVQVNSNQIDFIRFNRSNPQKAIDEIFQDNGNYYTKKASLGEEMIKAGVVIAGIAAIISLLSSSEKK